MSIKKTKVKVLGIKGYTEAAHDNWEEEKNTIHETIWDGDLGDWMEIGGEAAGFLEEYKEIRIVMTPIEEKN